VVFAEISKVDAAARGVPLHAAPGAVGVVHQPSNKYRDLANDPVLPNTVTVAPFAYTVESVGTFPDDGEFPLYITAYPHTAYKMRPPAGIVIEVPSA